MRGQRSEVRQDSVTVALKMGEVECGWPLDAGKAEL